MGPRCPKCGAIYDWTQSELEEVVYTPKMYFCQNADCREIYMLTADEITTLQEQLRKIVAEQEAVERALGRSADHFGSDSESEPESDRKAVSTCPCGTPIYTILDGLVVGKTGIPYEFEHNKIIWIVVPTQYTTCTHCLFKNYYENQIVKKPYVVCTSCQKAMQDYMGWDGNDVEGGFCFGGYGSKFDGQVYWFKGLKDGWHCYVCLNELVAQGKGELKYDADPPRTS